MLPPFEFRMQRSYSAPASASRGCSERHRQVGQNSKQENFWRWWRLARTPSEAVNYANELIREAERADKTKQALLKSQLGFAEVVILDL